jgi:hypothetical protein
MNGRTDFIKNALFLAVELSRAIWLVARFAPRLG